MSYIVGVSVGLGSVVGIALLTGWALVTGLKRGVIYSQRVGYSRTDNPVDFWFYTCAYAVMFAASAGLLVYFGFELLIRG